jgi:hypothetical protein
MQSETEKQQSKPGEGTTENMEAVKNLESKQMKPTEVHEPPAMVFAGHAIPVETAQMVAGPTAASNPEDQQQSLTTRKTYHSSLLPPPEGGRPTAQYLIGNDPSIPEARKRYSWTFGFGLVFIRLGQLDFRGPGVYVPQAVNIIVLMHGAHVDLSTAVFVHPVTTIRLFSICGGARVTLPRGVRLETNGLGICGGFRGYDDYSLSANYSPRPDAPLVKVVGMSICGGASADCNLAVEPLLIVQHEQLALV